MNRKETLERAFLGSPEAVRSLELLQGEVKTLLDECRDQNWRVSDAYGKAAEHAARAAREILPYRLAAGLLYADYAAGLAATAFEEREEEEHERQEEARAKATAQESHDAHVGAFVLAAADWIRGELPPEAEGAHIPATALRILPDGPPKVLVATEFLARALAGKRFKAEPEARSATGTWRVRPRRAEELVPEGAPATRKEVDARAAVPLSTLQNWKYGALAARDALLNPRLPEVEAFFQGFDEEVDRYLPADMR